jgi:hypothetical protein
LIFMASKLNDPNFGSRDIDPSAPQSQSKLSDPSFGSRKPSSDPYEQTKKTIGSGAERREQGAFERKFRREAKYGRFSQETKSRIVSEGINNFVNQIISQKQASLSSNNTSSTNINSSSVPSVVVSGAANSDIAFSAVKNQRSTPLPIPAPPASGIHVLGAVDGTMQWFATEDCE